MKKNDFELMCDEMKRNAGKRNKICKGNPIVCAKCLVEKYVHNDRDRLLKIKAEATGITYHTFVSKLLNVFSVAVSSSALVISIFDEHFRMVKVTVLIILVVSALV